MGEGEAAEGGMRKKAKRKPKAKGRARRPGIVARSRSQVKRLRAQGAEPVMIATVDREPATCMRLVPKPGVLAAGVEPRPIADYQPCGKRLPCPDHDAVEPDTIP